MLKDRAKQVVLACATFDSDGRLLVSQSGLMPCQTITNQFHQRVSVEIQIVRLNHNMLTPYRLLMTNSIPRIQSSSGSFEFRETGPAYMTSFPQCVNICSRLAIYKQTLQPTQAEAGHPLEQRMIPATLPHSDNYSVLPLRILHGPWERASNTWDAFTMKF